MNRDPRNGRRLLVLLLLTAFTLVSVDYRSGKGSFSGLRHALSSVVDPVTSVVGDGVRPVRRGFASLLSGNHDRATAERLQRDNDALRAQLRTLQSAEADKAQVDRLFGVAGRGGYTIVAAHVVGLGSALGFEWTALLDAGSRDGLAVDMTVVNGDGLVGRVKAVTATTATVLLLIDPASHVGARLEGDAQVGNITGGGTAPMSLELYDPQQKVTVGDRIVTFGSAAGRPFVPGVPIGTVSQVLRSPSGLSRQAMVIPFAHPTALDIVGVVVAPPRADPRDAVLPPKP